LYRGGGSIGIIGAARAGLLVAVDPADAERRVLASTKANLSPAAVSLSYRVVEARPGVAAIEWCGQSDHSAAALLAAGSDPAETATERTEATAWLKAMLADGPVQAKTLRREAEEAGHAWATIRRAQRCLEVLVEKAGYQGQWTWRLLKDAHLSKDAHPAQVSTFETQPALTPHKSLKNAKDAHLSKDAHPEKDIGGEHLWGDGNEGVEYLFEDDNDAA
jgi:hypothetical protein